MPSTEAIIGREAELQRLRDCLEGPERPVVAFLEGVAGVGKTALLEATVAEAETAGTRVLRARPTAAEAGSSFAALDDLLRPAIGGLPRLAEPQRRALAAALLLEAAPEPVDPRQVGLAALSLLGELPGPGPARRRRLALARRRQRDGARRSCCAASSRAARR